MPQKNKLFATKFHKNECYAIITDEGPNTIVPNYGTLWK